MKKKFHILHVDDSKTVRALVRASLREIPLQIELINRQPGRLAAIMGKAELNRAVMRQIQLDPSAFCDAMARSGG